MEHGKIRAFHNNPVIEGRYIGSTEDSNNKATISKNRGSGEW